MLLLHFQINLQDPQRQMEVPDLASFTKFKHVQAPIFSLPIIATLVFVKDQEVLAELTSF